MKKNTAAATQARGNIQQLINAIKIKNLVKVKELVAADATLVNQKDPKGLSPLYFAISPDKTHTAIAEFLIEKGAEVNIKNSIGIAVLHLAAHNGSLEIVRKLLKKGANANITDRKGTTPLHLAADHGHLEVAITLIENGALVSYADEYGLTPLHIASQKKQSKIVGLLSKKDGGVHVNTKEPGMGLTALHMAVLKGYTSVAEILLQNGANANARNIDGMSPSHMAAQQGDVTMAELLLQHKANVEARNKERATPLHLAAYLKQPRMVQFLLKQGANAEAEEINGVTPLYIAAQNGNLGVVNTLIENGAKVNAIVPLNLATPLYSAALTNNQALVDLLLKKGADVNQVIAEPGSARIDIPGINDGATLLHLAIQLEHTAAIKVLLQNNALVTVTDSKGLTPLHLAAAKGLASPVSQLLARGANVNAAASNGRTALYSAAEKGYIDVVNILLKEDVDINACTIAGTTPLQIASHKGHLEVVQVLLRNGAAIDKQDNQGLTPLYVAVSAGREDIVKALLENGATITGRMPKLISENIAKLLQNQQELLAAIRNKDAPTVTTLLAKGVILPKSSSLPELTPEISLIILKHCSNTSRLERCLSPLKALLKASKWEIRLNGDKKDVCVFFPMRHKNFFEVKNESFSIMAVEDGISIIITDKTLLLQEEKQEELTFSIGQITATLKEETEKKSAEIAKKQREERERQQKEMREKEAVKKKLAEEEKEKELKRREKEREKADGVLTPIEAANLDVPNTVGSTSSNMAQKDLVSLDALRSENEAAPTNRRKGKHRPQKIVFNQAPVNPPKKSFPTTPAFFSYVPENKYNPLEELPDHLLCVEQFIQQVRRYDPKENSFEQDTICYINLVRLLTELYECYKLTMNHSSEEYKWKNNIRDPHNIMLLRLLVTNCFGQENFGEIVRKVSALFQQVGFTLSRPCVFSIHLTPCINEITDPQSTLKESREKRLSDEEFSKTHPVSAEDLMHILRQLIEIKTSCEKDQEFRGLGRYLALNKDKLLLAQAWIVGLRVKFQQWQLNKTEKLPQPLYYCLLNSIGIRNSIVHELGMNSSKIADFIDQIPVDLLMQQPSRAKPTVNDSHTSSSSSSSSGYSGPSPK